MEKINKILPSLMFCEVFFGHADTMKTVIEQIIAENYYQSIELGIVETPREVRWLESVQRAAGLRIVEWLSSIGERERINFCALEENQRSHSIAVAKRCIEKIAEAGGMGMGISSGPDPGPALREEGRKRLLDAYYQIGETAAALDIELLLEPLDRLANKRNLLGPTQETLAMIQTLRNHGVPISFAWDAAHAGLNGENIEKSLEEAGPALAQMHLSNAVLEPRDPRYGDHHMSFGAPGFLTDSFAASLLRKGASLPERTAPLYVAVEVRCLPEQDPFQLEKGCREFLQRAMATARNQSN